MPPSSSVALPRALPGCRALLAPRAFTRTARPGVRRGLAAAILAVLAVGSSSCIDDSPSAPGGDGVRLAIRAQIDPGPDGRVVAILAYYHRANEDRIDLPVTPRFIAVPRGESRTAQLRVAIGACLADPQRMRSESQSGCRFSIELQLLDEDGEFISAQAHEVEVSAPGQTVNVPTFNLPQAAITAASSAVAFEADEMGALPVQSLVGFWSETGAALGTVSVEIEYLEGSQKPWLSHTLSEGSLTLRPTTTDVYARTHVALVRLTASREGVAAKEIEVSYTVRGSPGGRDFVMFGDGNFIDPVAMATPGNQRLVQRLVGYRHDGPRGSGLQVQVDCGRQSPGSYLCNGGLGGFVGALADAGVGTNIINSTAGTLTSFPAGVKLIVLVMPCQAYNVTEVNALKQFAAEGGRIALFSEFQGFYGDGWQTCSAAQNQLARELGSGITLAGGQFQCGQHFTLPAIWIVSHQITAGMTEVTMGCSSRLFADTSVRELIYDPGENLLAAAGPVSASAVPQSTLLPTEGTLDATDSRRLLLVPWTDLPSPTGSRLDATSRHPPPTER
ncbi:MAG TPA: hypothetical protein VMM18_10355 [Gemmatimonadaceae bacterium]|nr:hypothetical protein [Gemmatimonadaceae bacterium]